MNTQLLTVRQAAERSTLSRRTIQRLIKDGALGVYRVCSRVRIPAADLERYLDAHFTPARQS